MTRATRKRAKIMNRAELTAKISEELATTHAAAKELLGVVMSEVLDALVQGKAVALPGLGSLTPAWRKERIAHNPQNPEERVVIPGHTTVRFRIANSLKLAVKASPKQEHYLRSKS
jgi:nucleoid DNA-binding protein